MKKSYRSIVKKAAALLMCAAFAFAAMPPAESLAADTHDEGKTVSRADKDMYEKKRARKAKRAE